MWSAESKAGLLHHNERLILVDSLMNGQGAVFLDALRHLVLPAATLTYRAGIYNTASDSLEIVFKGRGAHGSTQPRPLHAGARAGVRRVDDVELRRGGVAARRLPAHGEPALLARGAARPRRRGAPHLLLVHGAEIGRAHV